MFATLLAGLVLAAFLPVQDFSFLEWDDPVYVTRNAHVRAGLTARGAAWALTTFETGNWHPLTWLSHMLDVQTSKLNPAGHHRTNLLLHLGATLLLFATLRRFTGDGSGSFFVAGLFGLHPLRVESVAWVAERKDVLSALLWMSAMAAYLHYVRRPGTARFLLLGALFALGLTAKPMLVTFPIILLLLDWWPLGRFVRRDGSSPLRSVWPLFREKIPLFLLAAGSAAVTVIAQRLGGALGTLEAYPFGVRAANALLACAGYVQDAVLPAGLAFYYPFPTELPAWKVTGAALLLAGLTTLAVLLRRRKPAALAGWFWFVVTLIPVIGLVKVGLQASADRYTYLPSIGLGIAVTWSVWSRRSLQPGVRLVAAAAAGLVLLTLAVATRHQLADWQDTERLSRRALAVTERNWRAHYLLGYVQLSRRELPEAIANLETATQINPAYAEAWSNLGNAYVLAGRTADAESAMRRAIGVDPGFVTARFNLGLRLWRRGDRAGAIEQRDALLRLDPGLARSLERFFGPPWAAANPPLTPP